MKRKFIIYLSIWISVSLIGVSWLRSGSSQEATAAAEAVRTESVSESPSLGLQEVRTEKHQEEIKTYLAVTAYLRGLTEARQRAAEAAQRARERQSRVQATQAAPAVRATISGDVWERLARCESGMTNANTGNGFFGFFQFTLQTWHGLGMSGSPTDYDYGTQRSVAQRLQARSGWGQWPACSQKLGLR